MVLRELLAILESKNHLGDNEQTTYSGWRIACKKVNKDVWFEGDKDIAQAMVGPKPFKKGETKAIGEWDGAIGSVYSYAKAVKEAVRAYSVNKNQAGDEEDDEQGMRGVKRPKTQAERDKLAADVKGQRDRTRSLPNTSVHPNAKRGAQSGSSNYDADRPYGREAAKSGTTVKRTNEGGPKEKLQKFESGWYVVDEDDVPFHGPFENERKANRECSNLGGKNRGYTVDYIEKLKEEMEAFEAWKQSVKDAYPDIAGKLKFKSNPEGNVEAVISGQDRIYGVFDVEKDSGEILKD